MKFLKRCLAALFCVLLLLSCAACSGGAAGETAAAKSPSEKPLSSAGWLPYGLCFGQTESQVQSTLRENGYNSAVIDGLTFNVYGLAYTFDWSFLHSEVLSYVGSVKFSEYEALLAAEPDEFVRMTREDYHLRLQKCLPQVTFFFDKDHRLSEIDCSFTDADGFISCYILTESVPEFRKLFGAEGETDSGWSWEKPDDSAGTVSVEIVENQFSDVEIIISWEP